MIDFREVHVPTVTHIGTLDWPVDDLRPSRDGPALAVSSRPDVWRRILRSNAPEVTLGCSNALWIDGFSISPAGRDALSSWAGMRGYLEACTVHCAAWVDPETGAFRESMHASEAEARIHAGASGSLSAEDGFRLLPRALARLGRWHDPFDWFGGALLLYAREVIILKRPLICGIWWEEAIDEAVGAAPCGQLLPEAFARFDVELADGDTAPLTDVHPAMKPVGAKPVELLWS